MSSDLSSLDDLDAEFENYVLVDETENDQGRVEYIDLALDKLHLLTPWERDFIKGNYDKTSFSPKVRQIIDRIACKHPYIYDISWQKQLSLSKLTSQLSTPLNSNESPPTSSKTSTGPDIPF
jgi:hypothetical protein